MRVHADHAGCLVSAERLNRDQFQARLAPLDDAALRKVLWMLYWRGSAAVRQRIETEIAAGTTGRRPIPAHDHVSR